MFEKLAWSWGAHHHHVLPRLAGDPRMRVMRYEDLFEGADKAARFRDMLTFTTRFPDGATAPFAFDPAILAERSHATRDGAFPGWRAWDPDLALRLEAYCGPIMRTLGYGGEPEWQEMLAGDSQP